MNNEEGVDVVQGGEVVLPQSDDGLYREDGIMDAYEVFKRVSMNNIMRAIQKMDRFAYGFVDFKIEQIECRKKYKLTILYDKNDPSLNEEKIIEVSSEEEGRLYRSMYRNPENAFIALVDYRDSVEEEWKSEVLMHYDKGAFARGIVTFCTKILQVALDHKVFTTLEDLKQYVKQFLADRSREREEEEKRNEFIKRISR